MKLITEVFKDLKCCHCRWKVKDWDLVGWAGVRAQRLGLVWGSAGAQLIPSSPPGALYQCCQGENAIHAWLGPALLRAVSYPPSPPSIHFLTASCRDYQEERCSAGRDATIHVCARAETTTGSGRWQSDRGQKTHTHTDTHTSSQVCRSSDKTFTDSPLRLCHRAPHLYNHCDSSAKLCVGACGKKKTLSSTSTSSRSKTFPSPWSEQLRNCTSPFLMLLLSLSALIYYSGSS